jgi:broad specificity phosphatase PhoE
MSRLLLVRHCESSGPQPDAPLTERGLDQAVRLATFLAAYGYLLESDGGGRIRFEGVWNGGC